MKHLFLLVAFLLCSPVMAQNDAQTVVATLSKLRADVEGVLPRKPYKGEEHSSIKSYFEELETLNAELEQYPRYLQRVTNVVREMGLEKFCSQIFLDKGRWKELVKNCTKNNFFLCSEKVREYPEYRKAILAKIPQELRSRQLSACE